VALHDFLTGYLAGGLKHILCTDISRDGKLTGPNSALYAQLVKQFPSLEIQASGGVSSLDDLRVLKTTGSPAPSSAARSTRKNSPCKKHWRAEKSQTPNLQMPKKLQVSETKPMTRVLSLGFVWNLAFGVWPFFHASPPTHPCLDVRDGRVVKGVQFRNHVDMGDIIELAQRYRDSGADELVFYDITASSDGRTVSTSG